MEENSSTGQFSPMPLFAGPDHSVEWSEPSGTDPSPLSTDSGLTLENLSLPSLTSSLPMIARLDSPEEAERLIEQFYDDIADTCPGPEYAISWVQQRAALERAYFKGGKNWDMKLRKIPMRDMPKCMEQGRDSKFDVKCVTPDYALAIQAVMTDDVARECARTEENNTHYNFLARVEGFKRRIAEAPTSAVCKHILEQLQELLEKYIKAKTPREERTFRGLVEMCQARLEQFPPEDDAVFDTTETPDKDKQEAAEEIEEPAQETNEEESKKDGIEEKENKDNNQVQDKEDDNTSEELPRKVHRVGAVVYSVKLEGDGASRVIIPSDEVLAQLRNYRLHDPEYAEPYIVDPDTEKQVTIFDRSRGSCIRGQLYGMTLANDTIQPMWHSLGVEVMFPCSVYCLGDEAVVADHERIRVLKMPTGKPTGEEYWLVPNPARSRWNTPRAGMPDPEHIHISDCRISRTHVVFTGVMRGQNNYLLGTVERGKGKKATVTMYASEVPFSTFAVPPDGQTVIAGFKDGTLLRWRHPTKSGIRVYAPTQQTYEVMKDAPLPKKQELVEYNRDDVMFCGANTGINDVMVRGKRIVASSTHGIHIFKPFEFEEESRAIHLRLLNNASFDLRGNILAIQKMDNSIMLVNTISYTLEVQAAKPEMKHKPPDILFASSTVAIRDRRITFFHLDGSMRVIELRDYLAVAPPKPPTEPKPKPKSKAKPGKKNRKK